MQETWLLLSVDVYKRQEYYEPLKKLKDSQSVTLFDYDLALNLYYFTAMWKERKKFLKKKELELFTRDCGSCLLYTSRCV